MVASTSIPFSGPAGRSSCDREVSSSLARQEARIDEGLVRRFNAGDETAFVEIVGRYRVRMLHAALGLLHNRADAEEIAQDTFIRAHRSLANFRGESSLVAWLYCIALNLARNRYWYFYRRHRHTSLPLDAALNDNSRGTLADLVACDEPGPVREAVNHEFVAIVNSCIGKLNDGQRRILILRNEQHHTYARISQILGIRVGTAKSRLARARTTLRVLVDKACPELVCERSPLGCFESLRQAYRPAGLCA